ncbi:MAG TPA: alternative ribosome rescue aminoacyl-tRNA hydrolase ArfB [Planctomicrobium sp.]|nr:alternative ribosome rescue aminoacyl-tRNA hydrolase ArfB [Planctomicrobium sp.]
MAVRDPDLLIDRNLSIPISELRFAYVRSSGPGGQNVNKVNSQVQLAWRVADCQSLPADVLERLIAAQQGRISKAGYLRIHSDRFRDREKNRQDCLDRLKDLIAQVAQPPRPRRKTKVPRRIIEARLKNKQQRSDVKQSRRRPRLDD